MVTEIGILEAFATIRTEALTTFFVLVYYFTYLTLASIIFLSYLKNKKKVIIPIVFLIIGVLIVYSLKYYFKVPRYPFAAIEKEDYSFPSNHMFVSIFSIAFLPKYLPLKYFSIIYFLFLVPFSLLYLGVHYPSDMIFSVFLGIILLLLSKLFEKALYTKTKNREKQ